MLQEIKIELKSSWGEVILAPVKSAKTLNSQTIYDIGEGDNTFHNSKYAAGGVDVKVVQVRVDKSGATADVMWPDGRKMTIDADLIKIHRNVITDEACSPAKDEAPEIPVTSPNPVNPMDVDDIPNLKAEVEAGVEAPIRSASEAGEPQRADGSPTSKTIALNILESNGGQLPRKEFKEKFEAAAPYVKTGLNRLFKLWEKFIQYDKTSKMVSIISESGAMEKTEAPAGDVTVTEAE